MKTKSEDVFETFLSLHQIKYERIEESTSPRPDYTVHIGDVEVIFEVKELTEDEQFGIVKDPKHPHLRSFSGTPGGHIRRAIAGSRRQVQYGANQGVPSVLLIYNNLDSLQRFGTDDLDFRTAMYGELTALIDRETRESTELFHGRNSLLQETKNTSFSAVGRLAERFRSAEDKTIEVTLFENAYAKVKLPPESLPPCFRVHRVNIVREPLEFR